MQVTKEMQASLNMYKLPSHLTRHRVGKGEKKRRFFASTDNDDTHERTALQHHDNRQFHFQIVPQHQPNIWAQSCLEESSQ